MSFLGVSFTCAKSDRLPLDRLPFDRPPLERLRSQAPEYLNRTISDQKQSRKFIFRLRVQLPDRQFSLDRCTMCLERPE